MRRRLLARGGSETGVPPGAGDAAGQDDLLWARRWVAFFAVANVLCTLAVFFFIGAPDYFAERDYANTMDWGAFGRGAIFLGTVLGSLVIYFGLLSYRRWSRWAYLVTNTVYLGILIIGHALAGFTALALMSTNLAIVLIPGMFYMFLNRKARLLFEGGSGPGP